MILETIDHEVPFAMHFVVGVETYHPLTSLSESAVEAQHVETVRQAYESAFDGLEGYNVEELSDIDSRKDGVIYENVVHASATAETAFAAQASAMETIQDNLLGAFREIDGDPDLRIDTITPDAITIDLEQVDDSIYEEMMEVVGADMGEAFGDDGGAIPPISGGMGFQ